jgi:acetyl-CoA acetyltransferase
MEGLVIKNKTAVAGIGQTVFGKGLPDTELSLACQAVSLALDDAGIEPSEVDGIASYTMEPNREVDVARSVGLGDVTWFSQVGYGGGAGCGVVGQAAMAVATGQCNVAIAWRARKRADATSRPWAQAAARLSDGQQWTRPFGVIRPVDEIALLTRRYMHEYGGTRDHLANIALAFRKHAARNPLSTMGHKPMTRDDYMNARWISEPLCLFDNCLETDGALACILVRADRAPDLRQKPAYIHSWAQGMPAQVHSMINYFDDDPLRGPGWTCADQLYRNSDIGPKDIQVAQLYDAFTPLVIFSLEAYGFCGRGEGGAFTDDGNISAGGRLPVNTSGGGLSEAYVHGFNHIVEGVRQVRGTSVNQVADCEAVLVTAGECVPTSAMILRG